MLGGVGAYSSPEISQRSVPILWTNHPAFFYHGASSSSNMNSCRVVLIQSNYMRNLRTSVLEPDLPLHYSLNWACTYWTTTSSSIKWEKEFLCFPFDRVLLKIKRWMFKNKSQILFHPFFLSSWVCSGDQSFLTMYMLFSVKIHSPLLCDFF